jgi:hypothetical protein
VRGTARKAISAGVLRAAALPAGVVTARPGGSCSARLLPIGLVGAAVRIRVANRWDSAGTEGVVVYKGSYEVSVAATRVGRDQQGHGAGDRLLRLIRDAIDQSIRPQDFAARIVGDEFAVILSATLETAPDIGDCASQETEATGAFPVNVGVAALGEPRHAALVAGIALYQAKAAEGGCASTVAASASPDSGIALGSGALVRCLRLAVPTQIRLAEPSSSRTRSLASAG